MSKYRGVSVNYFALACSGISW